MSIKTIVPTSLGFSPQKMLKVDEDDLVNDVLEAYVLAVIVGGESDADLQRLLAKPKVKALFDRGVLFFVDEPGSAAQ